MKKTLMLVLSLFAGIMTLSGCITSKPAVKTNKGSFTYHNVYDAVQTDDGKELALGLWDGYYGLDSRLLNALEYKDRQEYYVAGDILNYEIQGDFAPIKDIYPSTLELEKDAKIVSVSLTPAKIIKVKASEIKVEENNELITGGTANTIKDYIITSTAGDFIHLKDNNHEYLYLSTQVVNTECDGYATLGYSLYTFNPNEINNHDEEKVSCWVFNDKIINNEHKRIETKIYEHSLISISNISFNKNILEEDIDIAYDKESFDIISIHKKDKTDRNTEFSIISKKLGEHSLKIKVFEYTWFLDVNVKENDVTFDEEIDLTKYSEFLNTLNGFKYHSASKTSSTSDDEIRLYFDTYNTDYIDNLKDDCYYPTYFPDAPKSKIMNRQIEIQNDVGSIFHMNISVSEIDPGCTNPMDRVQAAFYDMVKISDIYKIDTFGLGLYTLIDYEYIAPYSYEINGLKFDILKQNDNLYAFFNDGTYFYSFMICYDMNRSV